MRSWQGEIAPALTAADAAEAIHAAAERRPGLRLERIAEVRGRYAAVFEVQPNPTYSKWLATPWHAELNDLLSSVLDTLEHVKGENLVNIFSAEMFEYLCAEMLPSDGRPVHLTVKAVTEEKVTGPRGEQVKMVMAFHERPKKLILNKTNARALARALGPETNNWRDAAVALGVESVKVGREIVPSIRVKSATPAQPRATQPQAGRPPRLLPAFADAGTIPPQERPDAAGPEPGDSDDGRAGGGSGDGDDGGELWP